MSKKDYEAIAAIFRKYHAFNNDQHTGLLLMAGIADYMVQDNPRFDRARFLAACRGEDAKDSAGRTVHYGR